MQQLGQQLGVTIVPAANGVVDVYTTGGAALVDGGTAYQLAIGQNQYGDGAIAVTYGPTGQDLTASLSGGQLGGLLASRAQLVNAQDSVGALAAGLAAAINTQQSLGLDLNGNLGTAAVFGGRTGRVRVFEQYRERQPDGDDHGPRQFFSGRFHPDRHRKRIRGHQYRRRGK